MISSLASSSVAPSSSSSTTSFDTYDSDLIAHYDAPTTIDGEVIPSYEDAMRPQVTTHIFSTTSLAKGTSISLELNSMAADPDSMPILSEGATVEGRVLLDLKKSGVKQVSLTIRGRATCIVGSILRRLQYDLTFLETSYVLWSSARGSSSPPQSLPFHLTLPKTFSHSEQDYALPPSYAGQACIDYLVDITVKREFLRSDYSLQVPFSYISRIQRTPLPRLSIGSIHYLPGPHDLVNTSRWHEAAFTVPGRTTDGSDTTLLARLLIPHPLCYPTGSTIPFRLFVSIPSATSIALSDIQESQWDVFISQHRICYLTTSTTDKSDGTTSTMDVVTQGAICEVEIDNKPSKNAETGCVVILSGEVCLPRDLTPSFQLPFLDLEYRVHIVPRIPGFQVLQLPKPLEIPVGVIVSFPQVGQLE